MRYSITCSTKTLTLAKAPLLFLLVGILCEFAIVLGVHILLSPQEKKMRSSSGGHRCTHSAVHFSKISKVFYAIILLCQGYC